MMTVVDGFVAEIVPLLESDRGLDQKLERLDYESKKSQVVATIVKSEEAAGLVVQKLSYTDVPIKKLLTSEVFRARSKSSTTIH